MVMQCLTGREFLCGTGGGVQGVRAKQVEIAFAMMVYRSIVGSTGSSP